MLVEYSYAGKSNFRQVFAEGVTAAEEAFREWNGLGDEIVAIYRAAATYHGKHDECARLQERIAALEAERHQSISRLARLGTQLEEAGYWHDTDYARSRRDAQ